MAQAPHPRMHGLTHLTGGADPIPGLIQYPTGDTMDEKILAAAPAGFWKLNESSGSVAADSSGHGQDMTTTAPAVDPLWGAPAGPPGEQAADFHVGTEGLGGTASRVSRDWPTLVGDFTAGVWANRADHTLGSHVFGQGNPTRGSSGQGWQIQMHNYTGVPPSVPALLFAGAPAELPALNVPADNTWVFLAATYNQTAAEFKFYVDGLLQGTVDASGYVPASGVSPRLWIGHDGGVGTTAIRVCVCVLSYAFLVNRTMSGTELEGIVGADAAGTPPDTSGLVLGLDENGNPTWVQQTVEVTGGGINVTPPDETPVDSSSSYGGTPTTPSGWHLDAHYETVILHDSTRGRFDVPTMKWTRVPFNAIRISRTWEPTVGSAIVKTALLPDDRGLSGPARDGILHINPDMVWSSPQTVGGWFSIEYPVLEPGGLPDDDPEVPGDGPRPEAPRPGDPIAAPDTYMRAARMMNVSQGYVLRMAPGSDTRAIRGWGFQDTANGIGDSPHTDLVDNPFPTYPIWAARPLHMLQPYPQMSPTESKAYYVNYEGDPGFRFDDLQVETDLAAGANLCLQAWQDSPWLIRFSTDRFPAYHGYTSSYRGYPYLQITFSYDPDTIDHTTGKLLLPAPT